MPPGRVCVVAHRGGANLDGAGGPAYTWHMTRVLWIAVAGGVGCVLRYWVAGVAQRLAERTAWALFPWGTLAVNIVGAAALGFVMSATASNLNLPPNVRIAITIGLLGGFTTYSTYAYETLTLASDGQRALAAVNFVLNNGLSLLAVWGGYRLGQQLYGVPA